MSSSKVYPRIPLKLISVTSNPMRLFKLVQLPEIEQFQSLGVSASEAVMSPVTNLSILLGLGRNLVAYFLDI